jgi:DNA uptake protein ComE-like DNA-binding protein
MFTRKIFASLSLALVIFAIGCGSGGDNRQPNATNSNANANATPTPAATSNSPQAKLNINTATQPDLLRAMPNLGSRMLHEFEEYRPYKSIQQFRKEIGKYVDQAQVAEYEKFIFVPIDPNQSDAPTLQQIPGLDANETQELIAARPYATREAFVTKLSEKVSAADLQVAKNYIAP